MFAVIIHEKGGQPRRQEFTKSEVTIGRVQGNDIILPKQNVSKRHSRVVVKDGKFIIVDLKSTNGTYVNGRKIASPMVIKQSDKIYIGDFILSAESMERPAAAAPEPPRPKAPPPPPPRRVAPAAPIPAPPAPPTPPTPPAPRPPAPRAPAPVPVAPTPAPVPSALAPTPAPLPPTPSFAPAATPAPTPAPAPAPRPSANRPSANRPSASRTAASPATGKTGPLAALLDDSAVERILVNGTQVEYTRGGATHQGAPFVSSAAAVEAAKTLLEQVGVVPDAFGEGHLGDGTRVHVAMPAVGGPYITIDRPGTQTSLDALASVEAMSANMAGFLRLAVGLGKVIVVSSNDIDSRYTLLSALADAGKAQRTVAIEGAGRLGAGVIALSGASGISRDAVLQNALKMRPERLIVGDCNTETFEALTAIAGSLNGGVLGAAASSPEAVLRRIGHYAASALSTSAAQASGFVHDAVDIVAHITRYADGRSAVSRICDVTEAGLQDVFTGQQATAHVPGWVAEARELGHPIDMNLFT